MKDKILERVRKLLAMANDSSSPNEAAIAANRARKLMDQHGLTQAEVDRMAAGDAEFVAVAFGKVRRFAAKWEQYLAVEIAKLNDCIVRFRNVQYTTKGVYRQMEFCGEINDVQSAVAMFNFLTDTVIRLCKAYMKSQGYTRYNARVGDAYKDAAGLEIRNRLESMRGERQIGTDRTGTSLMVVKQELVAKHFKHNGYDQSSKRRHCDYEAAQARVAGRRDGGTAPLSAQID